MNITVSSKRHLPLVTSIAYAMIRASSDYAALLRMTAPIYGHDNREIIGRVQANLPLDGLVTSW